MSRLLPAALFALLLAAVPALAADPPKPTGNWKFRFAQERQLITLLLAFSEEDGKWVGDFVAASPPLRADPKVIGLSVKGDVVKFGIEFGGKEAFNVEAVLAKDGKKLTGTMTQRGGAPEVTEMFPSKLKKLTDVTEVAREEFAQRDVGEDWFELGFLVAGKAADKKLTADEARGLADRMAKAAAGYGPRWEMTVALKLASTFAPPGGVRGGGRRPGAAGRADAGR